jgi:hypothetical protein
MNAKNNKKQLKLALAALALLTALTAGAYKFAPQNGGEVADIVYPGTGPTPKP